MQISSLAESTTMQCRYIATALVHDMPQIMNQHFIAPKCSEERHLRLLDYSLFTLNTPQKWSRSICHFRNAHIIYNGYALDCVFAVSSKAFEKVDCSDTYNQEICQ